LGGLTILSQMSSINFIAYNNNQANWLILFTVHPTEGRRQKLLNAALSDHL
jgi:hypothetical protein